MKTLSQDSFQKTRSYIFEHGRTVDQCLFEFHFESGSKEAVIDALSKYQNPDGGFGQAFESDLRSPLSTVYTTSQALFMLREVEITKDHLVVRNAVHYILHTYDQGTSTWPIIPTEALEAPHAGHWDDIIKKEFDDFFINMRAGLVSHFWHYSSLVPEDFVKKITLEAMKSFQEIPDTQLGWIFNLWSYLGLMNTKGFPSTYKDKLWEKLSSVIPKMIPSNPKQWTMMSVSPLNMAPSPHSPMATVIKSELIQTNLDYEIESQSEDGTWELDWSWEQDDPAAWSIAQKEWKAHLAIGKLLKLRSYNRF